MTADEYSAQLLEKAKEISFQMEVCVKDITWIGERIKILQSKVAANPHGNHEEHHKELNFLIQKLNINIATRAKIKKKNKQLGLLINGFFGQKIWKEIP